MESIIKSKGSTISSNLITIKLLQEIAKQKELALKGKSVMCFDDFNYHKINEAVFDIIHKIAPEELKDKKNKGGGEVDDSKSIVCDDDAFKDSEDEDEN